MNIQSVSLPPPLSNPQASAVVRETKAVPSSEQEKALSGQTDSVEEVKTAVQSVHEYIQPFNDNLEFSINEDTKQIVVKIIDSATKEVIRQMPSEEMIAIAKTLDSIKGLFVRQSA